MLTGWQTLKYKGDTDTYFFNSNGVMQTGLKKLYRNNGWNIYYFEQTTTKVSHEGAMVTGLRKINGYYYYFASNGKLIGDTCLTTADSRKICSDKNGIATINTKTKTYSSLTKLGTINVDVNKPVLKVAKYKTCTGPQGFTIAGNYYIVTMVDSSKDLSCVSIYDRATKNRKIVFAVEKTFGHTNDMTYNPTTSEVFIGLRDSKFKLNDILNKKKNWSRIHIYNEDKKVSYMPGIAYDTFNKYFYTTDTDGNKIYIYDSNFRLKNYFNKLAKGVVQGMGAYNGKVLVLRGHAISNKPSNDINTTSNSLDIYRNNGEYLGSYIINAPGLEVESISYTGSGNTFAIYTGPGSVGGQIFEVNINIPE